MRLDSIISEALRNIVSHTSKAALCASIVVFILVACISSDYYVIAQLQRKSDVIHMSGADITTLVASNHINSLSCDKASQSSIIQASGSLRKKESIKPLATPRNSITSYEVSSNFSSLLNISYQNTGGIWISQLVADSLKLQIGDFLDTEQGKTVIAGIYQWPHDGRDARLEYAVLIPTISGQNTVMDECWAAAWPYNAYTEKILMNTLMVDQSDTTGINFSTVHQNSDAKTSMYYLFTHRITRYNWIIAAVLSGVVAFLSIRRRKVELASNLHCGVRFSELLLTLYCEQAVWLICAAIISFCISRVIGTYIFVTDIGVTQFQSIPILMVSVVSIHIATAASLVTIREKKLYKYVAVRQ